MKKNKGKEYTQQICPICQTRKDSLAEYPELCPHISSLKLTHARPSCPYFKPINPNPNYKPPAFKNGDGDLKKAQFRYCEIQETATLDTVQILLDKIEELKGLIVNGKF